jgi:hypothetical protein
MSIELYPDTVVTFSTKPTTTTTTTEEAEMPEGTEKGDESPVNAFDCPIGGPVFGEKAEGSACWVCDFDGEGKGKWRLGMVLS